MEWYDKKITSRGSDRIQLRFGYQGNSKDKIFAAEERITEVDFFITPATVASDDIPYHGYMLLVVDAGGFVTGGEMLVANPDLQTMYKSVPEKLLDILIEKNKRPGKIRVESQKLFSLLLPLAKRLDIRVELTEKFTYLNQAKKGLIDHLKNMPG